MAFGNENIAFLLEGLAGGFERFGTMREERRGERAKQRAFDAQQQAILDRMREVQDRIDQRARQTRMAAREEKISQRAFDVEKEGVKARGERRKAARKADVEQTKAALTAETKEREKRRATEEKAGSFEDRYDRWLAGTYTPKTKQETRAFEKKAGVTDKKGKEAGKPSMSRDDLFKMWTKMKPEDRQWWGDKGIEEFSDFIDFYEENVQDIEPFAGLPTIQAGSQGQMGGPGLPEGAAAVMQPPPQSGRSGIDMYNFYTAQGVQGISPEDFIAADEGGAQFELPGQVPTGAPGGVTEAVPEAQTPIRQQAARWAQKLPGFDKMPVVQQQALIELKMRELAEGQ
jgi:hypothetical protein